LWRQYPDTFRPLEGSGLSGNNSYPDVAVVARTSCFADMFIAKVVLWERRPR